MPHIVIDDKIDFARDENERLYVRKRDGSYQQIVGFTTTRSAPNTASPVDVISSSYLSDVTDVDLALVAVGNGALLANVPDGTVFGGAKRGVSAVDFQTDRNSATQVASGGRSVILGGRRNTASGAFSAAGGDNSSASGQSAFSYGLSCQASGGQSTAVGQSHVVSGSQATAFGLNHTVAGAQAFAAGSNNTASGAYSTALGRFTTTNGIQGQFATGHASANLGRYQHTSTGLWQTTAAATAGTPLTADGLAASTTNQLVLRNNSAFVARARMVVYDTTNGQAAALEVNNILIKLAANAGTTALVGTPTVTVLQSDVAGLTSTNVTVSTDTTNGALQISVNTTNLTNPTDTIRWKATVMAEETQTA